MSGLDYGKFGNRRVQKGVVSWKRTTRRGDKKKTKNKHSGNGPLGPAASVPAQHHALAGIKEPVPPATRDCFPQNLPTSNPILH